MMQEIIKKVEGLIFKEISHEENPFYASRLDYKFIIPVQSLEALLNFLKDDFVCYKHGEEAVFKYHNTYFDTEDDLFFHLHRKGRVRRLKIRIREYRNGKINRYLECKKKGRGGVTSKERESINFSTDLEQVLNSEMVRRNLEEYGLKTSDLKQKIELFYDRLSFSAKDGSVRITLDQDIKAKSTDGREVEVLPGYMVLEMKADVEPRAIIRFVKKELRVREIDFSKYCIALCQLFPGLKSNRWKPIFKKYIALNSNTSDSELSSADSEGGKKKNSFLKKCLVLGVLVISLGAGFWWQSGLSKEVVRVNAFTDKLTFFRAETAGGYNRFEEASGLFRFEYRNHLAPEMNQGIYFLKDLRNQETSFQIFEKREELNFDEDHYQCLSYVGRKIRYQGKTICFSKENPDQLVANLELFGEENTFLTENWKELQGKGVLKDSEFRPYDFLSRAEALELAFNLRYPNRDFKPYASDCFLDVKHSHPLAGYVCYAQKNAIINGIEGNFYPDNHVNIFAFLKILFTIFEVKDMNADAIRFDEAVFGNMGQSHYAYPLMAKSLHEGVFENLTHQSLWSNQVIYKRDVIQITSRFLEWLNGKIIRNYESEAPKVSSDAIFINPKNLIYHFDKKKEIKTTDRKVVDTAVMSGRKIYVKERGNLFMQVMLLKKNKKIGKVIGYVDKNKMKIGLELDLTNGEKEFYETDHPADQFKFLLDQFSETSMDKAKAILTSMHLLPNKVDPPTVSNIPKLTVTMAEGDFLNLLIYRTGEQRYPGYLVMAYPDGQKIEQSILIKTRGNASKGYIKSSYNIEFSAQVKENETFEGDEFLTDHDDIKLRSFINEESMIHEKLFYETFRKLGHYAPDFYEAILEINGVPMGFYQVTEPIDQAFFTRRKVATKNFYYAQNFGSPYNTNLGYYVDDKTTMSQYETTGDPLKLLDLIKRLKADDPELIWSLDEENIFDYALLTFLANASDSLTHNYYLYVDEATQKWNIALWDGDASFTHLKPYSRQAFEAFLNKNDHIFNHLVYYLFHHLDRTDIDFYLKNFQKKWKRSVNLAGLIEAHEKEYGPYIRWDNALWNGKTLDMERENPIFDTMKALEKLKKEVGQMWPTKG